MKSIPLKKNINEELAIPKIPNINQKFCQKSCSFGDRKCSGFWMICIASSSLISSVNTVSDSNSTDTFEIVTLDSTINIV